MKQLRQLAWDRALSYLAERADMVSVRRHMVLGSASRPADFPQVYRRFLESLSNRQGMPNSIGDIGRLEKTLFGFDHNKTLEKYPSWEPLFDEIRKSVSPSSTMDKGNTHNYWTIFCKGVLSGARYFSRFDDLPAFISYIDDFNKNVTTRPALPFLMGEEIFGIKFPLACDFLKEMGFTNYCKPDVHLLDIFSGLGIAEMTPLDVFRQVSIMAEEVGETPYAVDKVFWLIGSGKLYLDGIRFKTDKHKFVRLVLDEWQQAKPTTRK